MNLFPPVANAISSEVEIGESIPFRTMFAATDLDGDAITRYRFRDNGSANFSGFFTFRGDRQPSNTWITVEGNDFLQVRYQAGVTESPERFSVQVFDGEFWSDVESETVTTIARNTQAPVVTPTPASVEANEVIPITDLFTVSDPENNPIERYFFVDRSTNNNGGYLQLNGQRLASGQFHLIQANQLAGLLYVGGTFGPQAENVGILASDGQFFSETVNVLATTEANNARPVVNAFDFNTPTSRVLSLDAMFSFSDGDGNTLSQIGIFDTGPGAESGFFSIDGVEQPAQEWIWIDAADIGRVEFNVSDFASDEVVRMQVTDGQLFSTIDSAVISAIPRPSNEVESIDIEVDTLVEFSFSDMVTQTDFGPEHDVYQIIDQSTDQFSSRLLLDGILRGQGRVINLTRAQFERLEIRSATADRGRSSDQFLVRSRNSRFWTDWDTLNVNTEPVAQRSLDSNSFYTPDPGEETTIVTYAFIDGTNNEIPVYYPLDDPRRNGVPIIALSSAMRDTVREIHAQYEAYANIDFVEVPYNTNGVGITTTYGTYMDGGPLLGVLLGYPGGPAPPGGGSHRLGFGTISGDIWFDNVDFNPNDPTLDVSPGSLFYAVTLHEIGHSIGFNHADDGDVRLPDAVSSDLWTVMISTASGPGGLQAASLLVYDVLQLQNLYGTNSDFNSQNDHYIIGRSEALRQLIWDGGGFDTLNFTGHSVNHTINLNEGTYSSAQQRDVFGNLIMVPNSTFIGYGAQIENARGGEGNDTIQGNSIRNLIFANGGDDVIEGDGGNDLIRGGAGDDTYIWRTGDGRDTIAEERQGGIDVIEVYDDTSLDLLQDDFVFRRFGNDLRIDLTFNRDQAQGTFVIREQGLGNSRVETLRMFDSEGDQIGVDVDLSSIFNQSDTAAGRFRVTSQQTSFGFIAERIQ